MYFYVGTISVFENQGKFYILTTPIVGQTETLYWYTLNDASLVLLKNISVSFTATSAKKETPFGHDFMVTTGQFKILV